MILNNKKVKDTVNSFAQKYKKECSLYFNVSDQQSLGIIFSLISLVIKKDSRLYLDEILHQRHIKKLHSIMDELIIKKKPFAYIMGGIPFLNTYIKLTPPILIPRQETEYFTQLIISVLKNAQIQKCKIVDICSGSGCIGIAILKELVDATCDAFDNNPMACNLALKNARSNKISRKRFTMTEACLRTIQMNNQYDCVVSNPPYISQKEYDQLDESVKNWEDYNALCDGENGSLYVHLLVQRCMHMMTQNGIGFIECNSHNVEQIHTHYKANGMYKLCELVYDQNKKPRYLVISNSKTWKDILTQCINGLRQ